MKRIALWFIALCITAGFCLAQTGGFGEFRQHGMATQLLESEGMSAAHHSIPIGSTARVHNLENDLITDVVINQRIPAAIDRIIDLAPAAASALGIPRGGTGLVLITPISSPGLETEDPPGGAPVYHITINNYVTNAREQEPQTSTAINGNELPPQNNAPVRISLPTLAPATVAERPQSAVQSPVRIHTPTQVQAPTQAAAPPLEPLLPAAEVRIIPGLPNPSNNRIYRLLVGTFMDEGRAHAANQRIQAGGFETVRELVDNGHRVFAVNIPAASVQDAATRLGALGFRQIWVYE